MEQAMVLPPPESNALLPEPSETIAAEEMIGVMSFLSSLESEKESQRLWALKAIHPVFFQAHPQLVSKVMMMLCHQSWPVKRQVLLLLQRLGREGRLGKEVTMNLQRLLYHPDNTLQLLVARILEHVPHADSHWKNVISDRNVAIGAVQKMGMALEFVETQFKEDPEIVLAAVSHTGEALQFAPKLCGSEEIVLAAVKETCSAAHFASEELLEKNRGIKALKEGRGTGLCGNYIVMEEIGKGVYGSVWRAEELNSLETFAIKKLHLDQEYWTDGIPVHTLREISLLRKFRHQNIVQLKDVLEAGYMDIRLVFEYLPCDLFETLRALRRNDQMMPMEALRRYSSDLLEGLFACHVRGIIHRDLKPQNILLTPEGSLKIADFGLSRRLHSPDRSYTVEVITLWYRAPELLLGALRYYTEVDIWSAGCVIAEMAANRPLFCGDSEVDTLFKIFRLRGSPSDENWPNGRTLRYWKDRYPKWDPPEQLQPLLGRRPELGEPIHGNGGDLLGKLLCLDPEQRPNARRAKMHPFLAERHVLPHEPNPALE